ncbi:MAG: TRAP transporter substrate-binding protein DctP [Desulfobacterales bacterium]|jgi:TRAP-type C4-dicarboxylate transport system substrate-binding protein
MKKTAFYSVVVLAIIFGLACITPMAAAKTYTITYSTWRGPNDATSAGWVTPMGKEIEKRSNGRIKFKVYWASALGGPRDHFTIVKDGLADMADFAGSWAPGKFNLSEVANLPSTANDARNVVKSMNILRKKGLFDKEWVEVELLAFCGINPYDMLFRKVQPMSVAELKGLKVRTPGGFISDYLKALGMIPVSVLPSDAYMAWQTGVVDAWVHPPGSMRTYKFFELPTKSLLDCNLQVFGNAAVIMNKKKFNSLPPDLQQICRDVANEYATVQTDVSYADSDKAVAECKKLGIPVYRMPEAEMNKIKALGKPMWDKYVNDLEAKGLPAKEVATEFAKALRSFGENPPYK